MAGMEWKFGSETISAEELKSIVYFLASDEMGGRDTDTEANRISSRYLAHQFELLGLEPKGDDGTYFQYMTLVRAELDGSNRLELRREQSPLSKIGVLNEDFYPSNSSASSSVSAPIVFCGYGITAPELGFDSYSGVETKGKIVVLFNGLPGERGSFADRSTAEYDTEIYKITNAQNHGAVGVVFVYQNEHRSFSRAARGVWPDKPATSRFNLKQRVSRVRIPVVYCNPLVLTSFLENDLDLLDLQEEIDKDLSPGSRSIPGIEMTLETQISRSETRVRNVLASLPGSDPELKEEVVIVGAHFDHVGTRNGKVYNGADDDASGTAAVLEIAEAFALSPSKPARSLLFALWNAEERGLFGAKHYTLEPSFPLEKTVTLYQLDMIGRNQEVTNTKDRRFRGMERQTAEENETSLHVIGHSYSEDLSKLVKRVNEVVELRLMFEMDQHRLNLIKRSDHWPFLVGGVPVLFFTTGLHPDYHTPEDTADKLNYPKLEKVTRLAYLCAWESATSSERPRLNIPGGGK